jgi:hypothetical protein
MTTAVCRASRSVLPAHAGILKRYIFMLFPLLRITIPNRVGNDDRLMQDVEIRLSRACGNLKALICLYYFPFSALRFPIELGMTTAICSASKIRLFRVCGNPKALGCLHYFPFSALRFPIELGMTIAICRVSRPVFPAHAGILKR